jgi:hypothetical protein
MKDVANQPQSPQGNNYNSLLNALSKPSLPTDFEQAVLQRTMLADLPKAVPPDSFEKNILQAVNPKTTSKLVKWLFAGVGSIALVGTIWFALSNNTYQGTSQPQQLNNPSIQSIDNIKNKANSKDESVVPQSTTGKTQPYDGHDVPVIGTSSTMSSSSPKLKGLVEKQKSNEVETKRIAKKVTKLQDNGGKGVKDKQQVITKHSNKSDVDKGGKIPQKLLDEE